MQRAFSEVELTTEALAAVRDSVGTLQTHELGEIVVSAVLDGFRFDPGLWDLVVPSEPVEGTECDPDNVDAADGWACQATPEVVNKIVPARFLNARKGDLILSPGGGGMIGGLLLSVSPPQRYSHCGIMTKNHTEITHSTGSGDRVEAYPVGSILGDAHPTDGHRPDVVKYGWPGVVTQSVQDAVNGSFMLDPESAHKPDEEKKWFEIKTFTPGRVGMTVHDAWEMVPALVIKPDPLEETTELRRTLRAVADTARGETGKSHYRFYCYTDPTIGLNTTAPEQAKWAEGTYPSVCSSFLWMMLRRHGLHLEAGQDPVPDSMVEPEDRLAGAAVDQRTLDGLYLYTAEERLAAARFLHGFLSDKVTKKASDEAGILGDIAELFSDMADDVANQICNAFASDWADTEAKDSSKWAEEPRSAVSVSPDNLLLYDGPNNGGVYGYAEPLYYREARIEPVTIHRWKQVTKYGNVHGRVMFQGSPIGGVLVQLYDGMSDFSDPDGTFRLEHVPYGRYQLSAGRDFNGVYLSANLPFELAADDQGLDVNLGGPPEQFRRVAVSGTAHIVDFEDFGSDEIIDWPFGRDLHVGPFHTHEEFTFVKGMGGEVRVEIRVVVDWKLDNGVHVFWQHRFFEGAEEDTGDLDGFHEGHLELGAGYWQSLNLKIDSPGAGSSSVHITFDNQVNPS